MAKLENNLLNMFLSLTVICVIVGGLLGFVASVTAEPIAKANAAKQENAIKAVSPDFETVGEAEETTSSNGKPAKVFPLMKGGKQVGTAIQAVTAMGFGGDITLMFGFDADGNITGYSALALAETPGLGSKIPTWFQEGGKGNVIGKNPATNNLTVTKDGGEVDAITAATISSRAFCDALAQAYGVLSGTDVVTSATSQVKDAVNEANHAMEEAKEVLSETAEAVEEAAEAVKEVVNNK